MFIDDNGMFIDDITNHLADVLTNIQSNIILGDFNMHIDDPTDTEVNIFNYTVAALGLS